MPTPTRTHAHAVETQSPSQHPKNPTKTTGGVGGAATDAAKRAPTRGRPHGTAEQRGRGAPEGRPARGTGAHRRHRAGAPAAGGGGPHVARERQCHRGDGHSAGRGSNARDRPLPPSTHGRTTVQGYNRALPDQTGGGEPTGIVANVQGAASQVQPHTHNEGGEPSRLPWGARGALAAGAIMCKLCTLQQERAPRGPGPVHRPSGTRGTNLQGTGLGNCEKQVITWDAPRSHVFPRVPRSVPPPHTNHCEYSNDSVGSRGVLLAHTVRQG